MQTATVLTLTTNCTVVVEIVFEKGKSKILEDIKVIEEIKKLLIECINNNHTIDQEIIDILKVTEVFKYSTVVVRAIVEASSIPPSKIKPTKQFVRQIAQNVVLNAPNNWCARYACIVS